MFARLIQLFSDFLFAFAPTTSSPALAGNEVKNDTQSVRWLANQFRLTSYIVKRQAQRPLKAGRGPPAHA
jgi:hypothetical protein